MLLNYNQRHRRPSRIWRRAGLVVLLLGIVGVGSLAGPSTDPATVVRRTTLIVHDVEASIRFYRDVLGFEIWYDNRGRVSENSLPNDAPIGAPSRFVIMKGRHPWIGMVGLLQYGEPRSTPTTPSRLQPGDTVLMLETEELDVIWQRMREVGTPILKPPVTTEVEGAGGARWMASFLFAWDPDGHLLEINQRGPIASTPTQPRISREYRPMRWGQLHWRQVTPSSASGDTTPVVLLHQSPLSGRMFSELLPTLGADRRVYAPDTPGYGESDPPPAISTIGEYADALHDVLSELKEPVDLVGYHTGAAIAAEYAARYPREVRRLVLISFPLLSRERRAGLKTTSSISEDGSHLLDEWRSTLSVRPPGQSIEQAARIVAEKQRAGSRAGWALAALASWEPEPVLRAIQTPTTVIRPKDGLWDAGSDVARLIHGSQLVDAPQWSYGLFDADPQGVSREIKRALD